MWEGQIKLLKRRSTRLWGLARLLWGLEDSDLSGPGRRISLLYLGSSFGRVQNWQSGEGVAPVRHLSTAREAKVGGKAERWSKAVCIVTTVITFVCWVTPQRCQK
jgi:hypothetical protein